MDKEMAELTDEQILERMYSFSEPRLKNRGVVAQLASGTKDFFRDGKNWIFRETDKHKENAIRDIDKWRGATIPGNIPEPMRERIQTIKKLPIFDRSTLDGLDTKLVKQIKSLTQSIEAWISKGKGIKPEQMHDANVIYQDWVAAAEDFEGLTDQLNKVVSGYVNSSELESGVSEASFNGPQSVESEKAELIAAFKFMGIEITLDEAGKYKVENCATGGMAYEINGETKTFQFSRESAQVFVDNYLSKLGPDQEKLNATLEAAKIEQSRAKKNLENAKKKVETAKKEFEAAEKALNGLDEKLDKDRFHAFFRIFEQKEAAYEEAKRELDLKDKELEAANEKVSRAERDAKRTLTPKGLFKFFVEQEIFKGNPSKQRDKELETAANARFSVDNAEWEQFLIADHPTRFLDDLSMVGLTDMSISEIDATLSAADDLEFSDHLNSKHGNGFRNNWRANRLSDSCSGLMDELRSDRSELVEERDEVQNKYKTILRRLEEKAKMYEKKGTKCPPDLEAAIADMKGRLQTMSIFKAVVKNLHADKFKDKSPKEIIDAVRNSIEITKDGINFTKDITFGDKTITAQELNDLCAKAKEALTAEQETAQVVEELEETEEIEPLPDVMASMLNLEFMPKVKFSDAIGKQAQLHRAYEFLRLGREGKDADNIICKLYDKFIELKKTTPALTAEQFFSIDEFKDQESIAGIASLDTLKELFDMQYEIDGMLDGKGPEEIEKITSVPGFPYTASATTKATYENANLAYFYMDMVANTISADPELLEQFENGSDVEREQISQNILTQLRADKKLENPTQEAISDAQTRWGTYANYASDAQLFRDFAASESTSESNPTHVSIAKTLGKIIQLDRDVFTKGQTELSKSGKSSVDYEDENIAENENSGQLKVKEAQFKEYFPRSTPAFKIGKKLQPFNIKAGLKFLDQIMEAFNDVMVKDPWGTLVNVGGGAAPSGESAEQEEQHQTSRTEQATVVNNFGANARRDTIATIAIVAGIKDICTAKHTNPENASALSQTLDIINTPASNGSKGYTYGKFEGLSLPDVLRHMLFDYATGRPQAEIEKSMEELTASNVEFQAGDFYGFNAIKAVMTLVKPNEIVGLISSLSKSSTNENGITELDFGSEITMDQLKQLEGIEDIKQLEQKVREMKLVNPQITKETTQETSQEM